MKSIMQRNNSNINRWLDPMFEDFFSIPSIFDRRIDSFVPRANIYDSEDKLTFTFEVPGMNKNDIRVTITDRVLTVSGRRETNFKSEKDRIVRQEMSSGEFERQFTLPEAVETSDIKAEYSNGILTIELDKKEEVKPRQVDVKIK